MINQQVVTAWRLSSTLGGPRKSSIDFIRISKYICNKCEFRFWQEISYHRNLYSTLTIIGDFILNMNEYEKIAQANNIYLDANVLFKTILYEGKSSNLVNILIYPTTIQMFSSYVALGEWIGKYNRKNEQAKIGGAESYLYLCRQLMNDFDVKKIKRAEPSKDKSQFIKCSKSLLDKYPKIGGADIWHLLAVLELKQNKPDIIMLTFDKNLKDAALKESIDAVYGQALKEPEKMIEELRCRNKWIGP